MLGGSRADQSGAAVAWEKSGEKLSLSLDRLSRHLDRCQRVDNSNLNELVGKFKTSTQLEDQIQVRDLLRNCDISAYIHYL